MEAGLGALGVGHQPCGKHWIDSVREHTRLADTSHVSLLASYFVATADQAQAIANGESLDEVPMEDGPALLPTDLGDLQRRIIGHESWSVIGDSAEQWVVRLGDDFAARIANLPDPIGDEVADELQLSSDEVDAVELMRRMAVLARSRGDLAVYLLITL